ncbi:MAG: TonB-dependent siderophore receptor [Lautropia sp.]|nr:TonB-dependent siderophore receptor [Lautropia sp.]
MRHSHHPHTRLKLIPLALAGLFAAAPTLAQAQTGTPDATELEAIYAIEKAASTTKKVNFKALEENTATDMKDVLFNEPSINFGGGNGTSQWATIRGMGQDQIDIKVDGAYTDSQIFHHNGRFVLDPALIKEIDVQKGTGSVSAGIGATSGAIVAKTVSARDLLRQGQTMGFRVNAGVGSNSGKSGGVSAYGQFGAVDALLVGNWVSDDNYEGGKGYRNAEGGTEVLNSALGQRGLLAKFGYSLDARNRLELSHRQEKTHGLRALREEFDFSQSGNTTRNDPRYRIYTQDTTRLEYAGGGFGVVDKIDTNVYRMTTKLNNGAGADGVLGGTSEIETLGANLNFDTYLFEHHVLKYGLNLRQQEQTPPGRTQIRGNRIVDSVNEKKTDTGVYAEGIWNLQPVTLTTGLRYDHFKMRTSGRSEVSSSAVNPSVAVIYDVNEQLSFNAGLYYATRSPRLYETMLAGGRLILADDNLKAEQARNLEVGVTYTPMQNLQLTGSVFQQRTKNHQDYQCIGVNGSPCGTGNAESHYRLFNSGTLKNRGYELNAAYNLGSWSSRIGVAYSKPRLDGEVADSATTAIPIGRTWTTGLSYRFDNPNIEVGWRGRFVQSAGYIPSSRGSAGAGAAVQLVNRVGYGVNDLYATWKPFGRDDLNVNFAVNNVFDKNYKSHSQRAGIASLPEPGRDVRLNVSYRF